MLAQVEVRLARLLHAPGRVTDGRRGKEAVAIGLPQVESDDRFRPIRSGKALGERLQLGPPVLAVASPGSVSPRSFTPVKATARENRAFASFGSSAMALSGLAIEYLLVARKLPSQPLAGIEGNTRPPAWVKYSLRWVR